MQRYILRRLLLMVPTLLGVTVVVFALMRFIPGDVVDSIFGNYGANPELKEQILDDLGLDEPVLTQYARYLGQLLRGDLGTSIISGRPVSQELANRLPVTLEMGLLAMLVNLSIALPVGILSAVRQDTALDYVARTFAVGFLAIPNFFLGIMVILALARYLHWLPPVEYVSPLENPLDNLKVMLLPAAVLGTGLAGTVMRFTRTQMLEVMRQDYIRTAWSKGLRERTVVLRHAVRNAFIPVITVIGLELPILVSGTLVVESIFNVPGVGRYFVAAIDSRDYPVVQSVNLLIATFIVFVNLAVDIAYACLDPRIRYR